MLIPGELLSDEAEKEQEFSDKLRLPGMTIDMQEKRAEWLTVPREVRAAIRRMHHMIGHKSNAVLEQSFKATGTSQKEIRALKYFHCNECDKKLHPRRTHPVAPPPRYAVNYDVIIDILEQKDYGGNRFSFLSIVCNGTTYHSVGMVREGGSQPSSRKCLNKFLSVWVT